MRPETRNRLLEISTRFYQRHGDSFDATRTRPWEGWSRLWDIASTQFGQELACLDAGCGNGRFLDFLGERVAELRYVGVDLDKGLLHAASEKLEEQPSDRCTVTLRRMDLVREGTERLGRDAPFDLVVLFGVLHHIPDESARRQLLVDLGRLLAPQGTLVASIWRLDQDRSRFERKVVPWDTWNARQADGGKVDVTDLDEGDALLRWRGDVVVPRYCHFPTDAEIERLASPGSDLEVIERFHADGPTDRDNLYLVWRRATLSDP